MFDCEYWKLGLTFAIDRMYRCQSHTNYDHFPHIDPILYQIRWTVLFICCSFLLLSWSSPSLLLSWWLVLFHVILARPIFNYESLYVSNDWFIFVKLHWCIVKVFVSCNTHNDNWSQLVAVCVDDWSVRLALVTAYNKTVSIVSSMSDLFDLIFVYKLFSPNKQK